MTADIGKPESVEGAQTMSDITGMYNNHDSVSYVLSNCLPEGVISLKRPVLTLLENGPVVSMHGR